MKKVLSLILSAAIVLCLAGCDNSSGITSVSSTSSSSTPEAVSEKAKAILQYLNFDLLPVGEIEKKVLASYSSVSGSKYTSDNIMLNEFSTKTLPLAKQLNKAAVEVKQKISDPDILAIHEKYITYTEKLTETLTMMISALKNQNMDTMNAANEKLNEANASVLEYRNEMTALANKNGVTIRDPE